MFSVHTTPEGFVKTQQLSPRDHDFVFEENSERKSYDYREVIVFEKLHFKKVFRSHLTARQTFLNFDL